MITTAAIATAAAATQDNIRPKVFRTNPISREYVDEIRMKHAIRFKDSASGSEWRTNIAVEFLYKGHIVAEEYAGDIRGALITSLRLLEEFDTLDHDKVDKLNKTKCFQPGCSADATVFYRLKEDYCKSCNQKSKNYPRPCWSPCDEYQHRMFCATHAHRGEGYYMDSDDNYERTDKDGNLLIDPEPVKVEERSISELIVI
jgi:hypothetical protein